MSQRRGFSAGYGKKLRPVKIATENLNKNGNYKGHNKKEKRTLIGACPHHKYTKKGKLKPMIFNNGDGTCICLACGARFPASFYEKSDLKETVNEMMTVNNQAKYMAVAIGADQKTVEYFCQMGVGLKNYYKSHMKVQKVAQNQNSIKKKKKKRSMGSAQYGSWK